MKYLIVIEKGRKGWSAYSPDLAGCVAAGRTRPAVERAMCKAVARHVEGLRQSGVRAPRPSTHAAWVEISTRA